MKSYSVIKYGKPLAENKYFFDGKNFKSNERDLILDFSHFDNVSFHTSYDCNFKTGSNCKFNTGSDCNFETGSDCTFKAGHNCTFHTGSNCTITHGSNCTFKSINEFIKKEEITMATKINDVLNKMKDTNLEAIEISAKIEIGNLILKNATKSLKKLIPADYKGTLDSPVADILIANLLKLMSVLYTGPKSKLINKGTDCMILSVNHRNISDISGYLASVFDGLFDGIDISKILDDKEDSK